MTVKELREWLTQFDGNLEVRLQYQDDGGCYNGDTAIDKDFSGIHQASNLKQYILLV